VDMTRLVTTAIQGCSLIVLASNSGFSASTQSFQYSIRMVLLDSWL
jgi:hypothetical protein